MFKHRNWSPALTPGKIVPLVPVAVTARVMALLCIAIFATPTFAYAFQEPNNAADESKLPEHAVMRLGEFGKLIRPNGFNQLAYSPDGKLLATRTQFNQVFVFDVTSGKQLCEIGGHEDWIKTLVFSPDAKALMTASPGNGESIKIWEPTTGKLLSKIDVETIHGVFSKSGKWIFALTRSDVFKYNATTGEQLGKTNFRNGAFHAKAISDDGRYVIVSHRMNNNKTYISKRIDLESDSNVILHGPPRPLNSVAISKDQRWIAATFHDDPDVRLWSMENPNDNKFTLKGHKNRAQSVSISPDNRFLVSTSWDQTAIVWDLLSRDTLGTLKGHTEHVNSSAFAPNSLFLATGASGSTDSSAIIWNLEKTLFPNDANKLTADDFQATWDSLGSTVVRRALNAVNDLRAASGKEVLEFIHGKMKSEGSAQSSKEIERWITELDSPDFKVREAASKSLINSLIRSESLLRQTLETDCSAETRFRIRRILGHEVEKQIIDIAELRRFYRAVFLLELIAADPAHKQQANEILQEIATGHLSQLISRDAAAAVERLNFNQAKPEK